MKTSPSKSDITYENEVADRSNRCLNCGALLHEGNFCHICGQHVSTGRLTTKNLGVNILSGLTRINGRFLYTVKELFLHPWRVINEYIKGRRTAYISPVQLLIVLVFIDVCVKSFLGHQSNDSNILGTITFIGGDSVVASGVNTVVRYILSSFTWLYILLLIPALPIVRMSHKMMGINKFNTAEYIVAALYLSCFILLTSTIIQFPRDLIDGTGERSVFISSVITALWVFVVFSVAFYKSLASTSRGAVAKCLITVFNTLACLVFYFILLMVLMAIHILSTGGSFD